MTTQKIAAKIRAAIKNEGGEMMTRDIFKMFDIEQANEALESLVKARKIIRIRGQGARVVLA